MDSGRMSERAPGSEVMAQVVRLHDAGPRRTPFARALGLSPLAEGTVPWFVGALGEREMGVHLARLPDTWRVFHALPVGSGDADLDHLAIGPAGVFVINTTHYRGARVSVAERAMLVNGTKVPCLLNADLEASRVRGLLAAAGIAAPVRAVVAVVGAKEVRIQNRPRTVDVVRGEELARWLARCPAVIDTARVEAVARLVDEPGTWREGGQQSDVAARFARIESAVRTARLVRVGWAVAGGLALLAVAAPFLLH